MSELDTSDGSATSFDYTDSTSSSDEVFTGPIDIAQFKFIEPRERIKRQIKNFAKNIQEYIPPNPNENLYKCRPEPRGSGAIPNIINSVASSSTADDENPLNVGNDPENSKTVQNVIKPKPPKKTASMKNILQQMKIENLMWRDHILLLEDVTNNVDSIYNNNRSNLNMPSEELRAFAVSLNFYAPKAYKHILENYRTPLPDKKVLSGWYINDNYKPGFTKQAFDALKSKRAIKGKRLVCSLIADDKEFNSDDHVCADVGGGNLDFEDASGVYVLMLVSMEDNWKLPVGYFFSRKFSKEYRAEVIKLCLIQCHLAGVDVVAVLLNSLPLAVMLGCEVHQPVCCYDAPQVTFKHPECDRRVAIFVDACLTFRNVRNCLESRDEIFDAKNKRIKWKYIDRLKQLPCKDELPFDKNRAESCLDLRNIIAKLELCAELLTPSVARGLTLCRDLKLPEFRNVKPTVKYITIMNNLYDVLNSKPGQAGYKRPICPDNEEDVLDFLELAKEYITSLFYYTGRGSGTDRLCKLVFSKKEKSVAYMRTSGFVTFLLSIESLKYLYSTLVVEERRLDCIPTHRLCMEHIDRFFENVCRHGRWQHAPDSGQFLELYRGVFKDIESKPCFTDYVIRLESYPMKNRYNALGTIKRTSGKRSYDENYSYHCEKMLKTPHEVQADKTVGKYSKVLNIERDSSIKPMLVGYIAGWAAAKLARALRCEVCIDSLYTNKRQWFHKLIDSPSLKAVCLPSEDLFKICWETEKGIKEFVRENGFRYTRVHSVRTVELLKSRILSRFIGSSVLDCLLPHASEHPPARNHLVQLIRAVITRYTTARVYIDESHKKKMKIMSLLGAILATGRQATGL